MKEESRYLPGLAKEKPGKTVLVLPGFENYPQIFLIIATQIRPIFGLVFIRKLKTPLVGEGRGKGAGQKSPGSLFILACR